MVEVFNSLSEAILVVQKKATWPSVNLQDSDVEEEEQEDIKCVFCNKTSEELFGADLAHLKVDDSLNES